MKGPPKITLTLTAEEIDLLREAVYLKLDRENNLIEEGEDLLHGKELDDIRQYTHAKIARLKQTLSKLDAAHYDCKREVKL